MTWLASPEPVAAKPEGVQLAAAHAVVDQALLESPQGGWLDAGEAARLLKAFGLEVIETLQATSLEEALAAADKIGFPVALKAAGGAIVHKTEAGAVALGLETPDAVTRAYTDMATRLGDALDGVVVQTMARPGIEAIVGLTVDTAFGPLLMFGLGGVATDLLGDHALQCRPSRSATRNSSSTRSAPCRSSADTADPSWSTSTPCAMRSSGSARSPSWSPRSSRSI